jgi:hypothetical protein
MDDELECGSFQIPHVSALTSWNFLTEYGRT